MKLGNKFKISSLIIFLITPILVGVFFYLSTEKTKAVTVPTVTTNDATDITATSATLQGEITDTGGEDCDGRGFDSPVTPTVQDTFTTGNAHGYILYNDYLYAASLSAPGTVTKIDPNDYSSQSELIPQHNGTNADQLTDIIQSSGYLWTCDDSGWLYKIDSSAFSVVGAWQVFTAAAEGLCSDGDYIYIGGKEGNVAKFKISDNSISNNDLGSQRYHAIVESGDYLYGSDINGKTLDKIAKTDLNFVASATIAKACADDVAQDSDYVYLGQEASVGGIKRVDKSDLSVYTVEPTGLKKSWGVFMIGDKLLSLDKDNNFIWVFTTPDLTLKGVAVLTGLDYSAGINELAEDSNYLHLTQFLSTAIIKLDKSRVLNALPNWTESNSYGAEAFEHIVSNLDSNTTYYYRAKAHNSAGWGYGEVKSFTTQTIVAPTVETQDATDITATSATLQGEITDTGWEDCDERGFDWGLTSGYGNSLIEGTAGNYIYTTGTFDGVISDLNLATAYHFRAKAHNSAGWGYGGDKTFFTLANPPSNLSLTTDSASQITASWSANSNPSGTEYYCQNTTAGTNSGWITDTSWSSSGLDCNTSYIFSVKARNGDEIETDSISSSKYTLANPPTNLSLTPDSASQITATWEVNSNPEGTEYYIENTTAGTNSGWITKTSWVSSDLNCSTGYTFSVKARNGDGIETDSISSSKYTLANPPSNLSLTADSTSQITASWEINSNPEGTEYYCENTTAGTNSGWITSLSWVSSNLNCSTGYTFSVKARNGDGIETDSISSTQSTIACPSVILPPPPPPPEPEPEKLCQGADFNFDGKVELIDFGILVYFWESTNPANPCVDINSDGKVDLIDFGMLVYQWGD